MRTGDEDEPGSAAGQEPTDWPETGLSRRSLLRTAGAASLVLPALAGAGAGETEAALAEAAGAPARAPGFFSAADLSLVDELAEMIVPADAHSPGARAAAVAQEIDRRLREALAGDPQTAPRRRLWRAGLRRLDALVKDAGGGAGFMAATPQQRLAVLTEIARNELAPRTPDELFFVELKREVTRAYYTSEIGVMKEMEYKGNTYLQEFVGHDAGSAPVKIRKGP